MNIDCTEYEVELSPHIMDGDSIIQYRVLVDGNHVGYVTEDGPINFIVNTSMPCAIAEAVNNMLGGPPRWFFVVSE